MATKTFKVALSLDNPRLIQTGITVHSFDRNSVKISISLTKDSQAYKIPTDAKIRISMLKGVRQEQKIVLDVPNNSADSIEWVVPDYLDGYSGSVRCGVYLINGAENVDLGYFSITSKVSDIDNASEEFTDNVFQGWDQIEADLNELNLAIAHLEEGVAQVDSTIANINAKNTQINTLHSNFTADVATKQSDVTNKYNAFDTSVTTANQTIDDILGLADNVQQMGVELNKKANKTQEAWITPTLLNGWFSTAGHEIRYMKDAFGFVHFRGRITGPSSASSFLVVPLNYRPEINTMLFTAENGLGLPRIEISASSGSCYSYKGVGTGYIDVTGLSYKAV